MMREHSVTAPATAIDTDTTISLLGRISTAIMVGGVTWIVYYAMWLFSGSTTGQQPVPTETFGMITNALFSFALVGINSGIFGLALRLRARSAGFANAGLAIAVFGLACSLYSLIGRAPFGLVPSWAGGFGVISSCLSAMLVAIAALRSKALPRRENLLLLAIGVATFPLIVAITSILPSLPSWVVDELPFAVSGATWVVFAALLKRQS